MKEILVWSADAIILTEKTEVLGVIHVSLSLNSQKSRNDCPEKKPDLHDEGAIYNRLSHDIVTEPVC